MRKLYKTDYITIILTKYLTIWPAEFFKFNSKYKNKKYQCLFSFNQYLFLLVERNLANCETIRLLVGLICGMAMKLNSANSFIPCFAAERERVDERGIQTNPPPTGSFIKDIERNQYKTKTNYALLSGRSKNPIIVIWITVIEMNPWRSQKEPNASAVKMTRSVYQ